MNGALYNGEEVSGRDNQTKYKADSEKAEIRDNCVLFAAQPVIQRIGQKDGTRSSEELRKVKKDLQLGRNWGAPSPILDVKEKDTGREKTSANKQSAQPVSVGILVLQQGNGEIRTSNDDEQ